MYSLEQLKAFAAVCECGSMSAAARKLGKAQSGISTAVSNLEIELNQTLFERSKNAAVLTDNGKALLPVVQNLLQQLQFFDQKVDALANQEEDNLSIAFEDTLWEDNLIEVFVELRQRFPHTNVDLQVMSAADILPKVESGELHIGILHQKDVRPDFRPRVLGRQSFVTAAASNHPLAALTHLSLNDLAQYCQITHHNADAPVLSPQCWRVNSYYLMIELVDAGLGWGNLPENLLETEWLEKRLVKLNLPQELNPNPPALIALTAFNHEQGKVTRFLLDKFAAILAV